jgi:hypothetical protein
MKYTFYNPDSGEIFNIIDSNDPAAIQAQLQNQTWIEGEYHFDRYYIEAGQPVVKTQRPLDGYPYEFDWTTKTWILNQDQFTEQMRIQRNQMLAAVDRVNPVWFNALTPRQQQDLITYRQALLAVPQQSGFPATIDWPAKPTWL